MSIINRNVFPPGGWRFYQPETGWSIPDPMSTPFDTAVSMIQAHRRANPALADTADKERVEKDLEEYTTSRTKAIQAAEQSRPSTPCQTCGRR